MIVCLSNKTNGITFSTDCNSLYIDGSLIIHDICITNIYSLNKIKKCSTVFCGIKRVIQ